VISLEQIEVLRMQRKEGEMTQEEMIMALQGQDQAMAKGIELGKAEGAERIAKLEAENERLRGILSEVSAECGRALELVDQL